MTTPTIRTSASMVTLLSVKFSARIIPKVEMTEQGIATAAIKVERHERMNNRTTRLARILPNIRWRVIS